MSSSSPDAKRPRLDSSAPLIGTHNGHFHADEALAVHLLRLLPTYSSSPVLRTRDPAQLATCHTVVDVGGEYTPPSHRYDHHQRTFTTTFPGRATKLSSAGLVYMHFGKAIIAQRTGLAESSDDVALLYEKLYADFVEAFDANDNGIAAYDARAGTKRFEDRAFSLAAVVNRYNFSPTPLPPSLAAATQQKDAERHRAPQQKQEEEDARFALASAFVGHQFEAELLDKAASWLPARAEVSKAFASRGDIHPSGRIMLLPRGMPWADHLYDLERAAGLTTPDKQVLYVLFPESEQEESKWRIRAVSVEDGGFENRRDLPDAWKGLRDEELEKVSGVKGAVFIHASGFIGGATTREGVLQMAGKAVGT